ncbi:hypothetical protein [Pseudolysinimonas sp.]|jgi:hypothetical protein|uniref:hypothetical protein n=1 Tax=Pseudolysinimonas sp. TaxID=2680009 RepID=UPI0037852403
MRKHIGVMTGTSMAGMGLVLVVASLAGFSAGLPAVQPASTLGVSWFMVAVVLIIVGAFVGLAARGLELEAEEHAPVRLPRAVRHLHPTR